MNDLHNGLIPTLYVSHKHGSVRDLDGTSACMLLLHAVWSGSCTEMHVHRHEGQRRWIGWSACCTCRYGFEALVVNEFHGASGFFFTPYAQKRIPGAKLPSVEVDGDTILGTFGFELQNISNNVAILCLLLVCYLTLTLLLLTFKKH